MKQKTNLSALGPASALMVSVVAFACSGSSVSDGAPPFNVPADPNNPSSRPGYSLRVAEELSDSEHTRVVRLSHSQYANTVRELLGIDETPENIFAPDALNGFGFATSNDLRTDARLGPQYRTAAEDLATRAVTDSAVFARLVTCQATDPACDTQFIRSFGQRVFRRPLTSTEVTRFEGLFAQGGELGDQGDPFRDGVQLVVEAMLQAPQFLYRTEVSTGSVTNGRANLDDWEIASRLSYLLYDSMPDAPLFARATAGELRTADQIANEVSRMLGDVRASDKLVSFHEQVWQFGRFAKISPDASTYPGLPTNLIDRVRGASSRFVESVIEDGGGLREFLTANYAFADSGLGPLYGSTVSGNDFSRIDFAGGERKGFLMQVGFLASNAYSIKTDPIHRGLFILRDVLCRTIPDPPPGAQMTPPPETDEPIITTRDEISLLTGQLYCPTCHSQINEPGFSFEGFDAVGRVRRQENGADVDTTGSITLDGTPFEFGGAGELVEALADSEEARDCYTGRFVEFAYGRGLAESDLPLLDRLVAEPRTLEDIVTTLVTSPDFLSHASGAP